MNPSRPVDGTNTTVVLKSFLQLFEGTSSLLLEDFKLNEMDMLTRQFIAWEIDVCLSQKSVLMLVLSFTPRLQGKRIYTSPPSLIRPYSFPLAYCSAITSPAIHFKHFCPFTPRGFFSRSRASQVV